MKWTRRLASRLSVIGELFRFLWQQRLWWLIPCVVALVLLGLLLLLAQSAPVIPFLYPLF